MNLSPIPRLTELKVEDKAELTKIETRGFFGSSLKRIEIPRSVETIGDSCFADCTRLASVAFQAGSQLHAIGNSLFADCAFTEFIVPAAVCPLGERCFAQSGLRRIAFESDVNLMDIGAFSFEGTKIIRIHIPSSISRLRQNILGPIPNSRKSKTMPFQTANLAKSLFRPQSKQFLEIGFNKRNPFVQLHSKNHQKSRLKSSISVRRCDR
jgi:hypothetical protein